MHNRTARIIGWTSAILVALFMIVASALPKFFIADGTATASFMRELGAWDIRYILGVLEILCPVLFLIPRTSTVGFVLTVGFLAGALATNLTHPGVPTMPIIPIILLLLTTISAYVRTPELLSRLLGRPVPEKI